MATSNFMTGPSLGDYNFDSSQIPYIQDFNPGGSDVGFSNREAQRMGMTGDIAAQYADPFMSQRPQYQKALSDLVANPGAISSSPYYKFLMDEAMNKVNANAAASGMLNSGRRLAALSGRAQDVASQAYFPQADLLSRLSGAYSSSPSSAGSSYARAQELAANYRGMGQAQRNQRPPSAGTPWWMQQPLGLSGALPSGGGGYSSNVSDFLYKTRGTNYPPPPNFNNPNISIQPGQPSLRDNWDPSVMGDPNAYGLSGGLPGYQPTQNEVNQWSGGMDQFGGYPQDYIDPSAYYGGDSGNSYK
jgi:hypothetical protein